ncbi:hypothetical protein MP638_000282 [Amoeboaphelidium occidentale]|nr:hypothetical protein MP638_000282 [Amoeboaphelidium occidentale]
MDAKMSALPPLPRQNFYSLSKLISLVSADSGNKLSELLQNVMPNLPDLKRKQVLLGYLHETRANFMYLLTLAKFCLAQDMSGSNAIDLTAPIKSTNIDKMALLHRMLQYLRISEGELTRVLDILFFLGRDVYKLNEPAFDIKTGADVLTCGSMRDCGVGALRSFASVKISDDNYENEFNLVFVKKFLSLRESLDEDLVASIDKSSKFHVLIKSLKDKFVLKLVLQQISETETKWICNDIEFEEVPELSLTVSQKSALINLLNLKDNLNDLCNFLKERIMMPFRNRSRIRDVFSKSVVRGLELKSAPEQGTEIMKARVWGAYEVSIPVPKSVDANELIVEEIRTKVNDLIYKFFGQIRELALKNDILDKIHLRKVGNMNSCFELMIDILGITFRIFVKVTYGGRIFIECAEKFGPVVEGFLQNCVKELETLLYDKFKAYIKSFRETKSSFTKFEVRELFERLKRCCLVLKIRKLISELPRVQIIEGVSVADFTVHAAETTRESPLQVSILSEDEESLLIFTKGFSLKLKNVKQFSTERLQLKLEQFLKKARRESMKQNIKTFLMAEYGLLLDQKVFTELPCTIQIDKSVSLSVLETDGAFTVLFCVNKTSGLSDDKSNKQNTIMLKYHSMEDCYTFKKDIKNYFALQEIEQKLPNIHSNMKPASFVSKPVFSCVCLDEKVMITLCGSNRMIEYQLNRKTSKIMVNNKASTFAFVNLVSMIVNLCILERSSSVVFIRERVNREDCKGYQIGFLCSDREKVSAINVVFGLEIGKILIYSSSLSVFDPNGALEILNSPQPLSTRKAASQVLNPSGGEKNGEARAFEKFIACLITSPSKVDQNFIILPGNMSFIINSEAMDASRFLLAGETFAKELPQ